MHQTPIPHITKKDDVIPHLFFRGMYVKLYYAQYLSLILILFTDQSNWEMFCVLYSFVSLYHYTLEAFIVNNWNLLVMLHCTLVKISPNMDEASMGRVALGAKVLAEGGYKKIYLSSLAWYLSTPVGSVMVVLYISTTKIDYYIRYTFNKLL